MDLGRNGSNEDRRSGRVVVWQVLYTGKEEVSEWAQDSMWALLSASFRSEYGCLLFLAIPESTGTG